jgi:orotidine-5'-phosphate decarboxylase
VSFLTIQGNGSIIQAAVEGRGSSALKLLSVTVLTSLDSEDIRDLGFPCSLRELVVYRATKAMQAGCDGVITSPREAEAISDLAQEIQNLAQETKGISPRKFLIVTPGVRPGDSLQNDHKRLDTPAQAIASGADFLVIGRPIRDASDPRQAAAAIIAEMQTAFENRERGL